MGDGLNRAQRSAVTTLSGPLLVLAGAGTGKTRVITFRIAELIRSGIAPNRILAVTFTNKAAREMNERAQALLGGKRRKRKKKAPAPEISTFHSLCVRVLRRHIQKLGYPEQFTIYDRGDQESIARNALRDIRVGHQKLRPGELINIISGWKSQSVRATDAEEIAQGDQQVLAAAAYGRYQAALRAAGAVDFDDLLLLTEQLFQEHPDVRFAEASRFDHLLIDEYQDTNGLQYRIVRHLAGRHRNLCVVGDDDQSIYGWRGAEVQHILNFKDDWPEAKVVRLEENYRSTEWVLRLANTLIAHNSTRHDKVLRASRGRGQPPRFLSFEEESQEAENVVREIASKVHREDEERVVASDIAILFRTNEQPRAFEQELRRANVPYVLVGGQSFFDRKEIKDLLSYLKVLANPNDEVSLLRIINTPARGIGTGSVQTLLDDAVSAGQPLWKILPTAPQHPDLSQGASEAVEDFRHLIDEFRARLGRERLSDLFRELVGRIDYRSELERQYKDPADQEARMGSVEELVNAVAAYENRADDPSLLGFLEETALSTREDQKDSDDKRQEHALTLMTLHSAKGLEFPHVYLVGMEEGLLPHKRSIADGRQHIDEERRLAYVGVTRAQDTLTLTFCKNRLKWGKLRPQIPSRFLMEMRGETERAQRMAEAAEEEIGREVRAAREQEEQQRKKADSTKRKKRTSATSEKPRARRARAASSAPPARAKTPRAPAPPDPEAPANAPEPGPHPGSPQPRPGPERPIPPRPAPPEQPQPPAPPEPPEPLPQPTQNPDSPGPAPRPRPEPQPVPEPIRQPPARPVSQVGPRSPAKPSHAKAHEAKPGEPRRPAKPSHAKAKEAKRRTTSRPPDTNSSPVRPPSTEPKATAQEPAARSSADFRQVSLFGD